MTSQTLTITHSPWGAVQHETHLMPGLVLVSTASHGGVHVSPDLLKQMHPEMAALGTGNGWFEEDCEVYAVMHTFPAAFVLDTKPEFEGNCDTLENVVAFAEKALRDFWPDQWEAMTGEAILEGGSFVKDKRLFAERQAEAFVAKTAWGDWHDKVPAGLVGVRGVRKSDGAEAYFLVPVDQYRMPRKHDFVIDEDRHDSWDDPA